jgi:uncharacterized protein
MIAGFFRFLLYSILAFFAYRTFRAFMPKNKEEEKRETVTEDGVRVNDVMVKDPSCGVYLPKGDAVKERIKGKTHYFCSGDCVENFRKGIVKETVKEKASETVGVRK